MKATGRQRKFLNFFNVRHSPDISQGGAGWEIEAILEDDKNRERWRRYVYLTKDFDSGPLREYSAEELQKVQIPEDWDESVERKKHDAEIVSDELSDGAPFDAPSPPIEFKGNSFMFTGKFGFGSRKACQKAVVDRGGEAPAAKSVSRAVDYLVVGAEGSKAWKRGSYGNKIEEAVISRREHGKPAIVSEEWWVSQLGSTEPHA